MKQKVFRNSEQPKKSLSQNFLVSQDYINRFNDTVFTLIGKESQTIEIGPGKGALTEGLYNYFNDNLYMVELDDVLCAQLKLKFKSIEENIYCQDFLRFDLKKVSDQKVNCVGNIPFGISSPIIFNLLKERNIVEKICFILQKEVALRLAAKPGSKDYGVPSVLLQAYYDVHYQFDIPSEAFFPKPKVISGVVTLQRNYNKKVYCNEKIFFQLVKLAFNQRRKTLRNALKSINFSEDFGLIGEKRAEQLSIDDFIFLSQKAEI